MKKKFDKLVLGAGEKRTEGFAHQDINPDIAGLDLVCPAEEIDKYVEENSVKELQATHLIEHFPAKQVAEVLRSWYKILAPEGQLYLEVPNFRYHAQLILVGKEEEAIYYAFGGQKDEWDFHKTGFTPRIIERRLKEAGFVNVEIAEYGTMLVWAYKPK